LAVLPLSESTTDNDAAAFGNGLVETLTSRLTQLTKNHSFEVVPASEVRAKGVTTLREANQQFGATLGLQLNIERSGAFVRVNYALIDAIEHKQLGGDTVTAPASDPFALEDRVADSIVKSLEIEIQPREHQILIAHGTVQPAAYEYYLQGRGYLQDFQKRENVESAITEFGHALEQDPQYALAFAGLGEAYWRMYELDKDNRWVTKAQTECQKAVALDARQTESHVCLGMVYSGTGEYEAAVAQYQRAVESEPTNDDAIRGLAAGYASLGKLDDAEKTYQMAISTRPQYWRGYNSLGSLYISQGRYTEAAEMFSRVVGLAPDSFRGYSNLGAALIFLGHYSDAVKALESSIRIRPTLDAYSNLGTAFFHLRQFDVAARYFTDAAKLNGQDYVVWGNLGDAYYYSGSRVQAADAYEKAASLAKLKLNVNPHDSSVLGDVAAYNSMLNRRTESLAFLNKALREAGRDDPDLFFDAAMIHNQFGETKVALEWMEKALAAGYSPSTAADTPALDNLHANPQFQAILTERTAPKSRLRIERNGAEMSPKHKVCSDFEKKKGDDFDWDNPGDTDCEITGCDPPLTKNHYHVPKKGTTPASVRADAKVDDYPYTCLCGKLKPKSQPKIIIGND
jgi:serine/threonine-protein kinase